MKYFLLLWSLCLASPLWAKTGMEGAIVTLKVTKQSYDFESPWRKSAEKSETHLGVVLPSRQILTTAFAVVDATYIEMIKFGSSKKYDVNVTFVDREVNLAVLAPALDGALRDLSPVSLGGDLEIGEGVGIFKRQDAYQLAGHPARMIEVRIFRSLTGGYGMLMYQLKVQQSSLGWSEPVFSTSGALVALTTGQDDNYVHAIPIRIVKKFLSDLARPPYKGFPNLGISYNELTSKEERRYFNVESYDHGIRVGKVFAASSSDGVLLPDDVLIAVDGKKVSEHGYIEDARWGLLGIATLFNEKNAGDKLKVKFVRQGQVHDEEILLKRFSSNHFKIPTYSEKPPAYLIFGGLVLQELERGYLKLWGKDWDRFSPFDLLYLWNYENDVNADRFIVLGSVLADAFNRGYDSIKHHEVTAVNGRPVGSIAAVEKALREAPVERNGERYARISLAREGGEIILKYSELQAVHQRLANTYDLPQTARFFAAGTDK